MSNAAHAYTPPETTRSTALPAQVARYLDGNDLLAKTQALRLSTVDAEGWPHASLLSAGDMLALPSGRIRFVVFPQSTTTANLVRDGRVTVTLSLDGGMCELRMKCRRLAHGSSESRSPSSRRNSSRCGSIRRLMPPSAEGSHSPCMSRSPCCRDGKSRSPR